MNSAIADAPAFAPERVTSDVNAGDTLVMRSTARRAPVICLTAMTLLFTIGFNLAIILGVRKPEAILAVLAITSPGLIAGVLLVRRVFRLLTVRVSFGRDAVTFPAVRRGSRRLRRVTVPYTAIKEVSLAPAVVWAMEGKLVGQSWVIRTTDGDWCLQSTLLGDTAAAAGKEICVRAGNGTPLVVTSADAIVPKSVRRYLKVLPWVLLSVGIFSTVVLIWKWDTSSRRHRRGLPAAVLLIVAGAVKLKMKEEPSVEIR